ncbi:MAG: L-2,4-diaminobutyrate decarboxylase [Pirellulaceae bacterium]|jgi:L-2,4-diaminobutyrate decarboxylase
MTEDPMPEDTTTQARRRIADAYSPSLLRELAHVLADKLGDHLSAVQNSEGSVLNWQAPDGNIQLAREVLSEGQSDLDASSLRALFCRRIDTMLARGHNLHDPRYIGHKVPAPLPIAGLFDAVGSVTNQVMAIYEMGPWATSVERAMIEQLGEKIGWAPDSFAGLITHGGSLANLTALLTARNVAFDHGWENGIDVPTPTLVVHGDSHYSVSRSAGILGIGTKNVVKAELDELRRIDPQKLDDQLASLKAEGRSIMAVVACACATPIGAFDPLAEIAAVCQQHQVWMHVDAAHGGAVCFSDRHKHLLNGWEQVDSLIWDAHKMMFVPALCAFVFYKNKQHRFETFRQNAPYLFDPSEPGMAEYDSGLLTVECTKRATAYGLWGVWSLFGPSLFGDMVDVTFDTATKLHEKLEEAEDFQALHKPQCNIVAFRHIPKHMKDAPPETIGRLQHQLRHDLIRSGEFYIVQTTFNGVPALRVTVCNPLTDESHIDQLLDELRKLSRSY